MTGKDPGSNARSGVNRRAFLKGSGAVAAATALHQAELAKAQDEAAVVVRESTTIKLDVNGAEHTVKVEPRDTLLETLRYQLDLTGAKPVSLDGSSGACTVLVDGKPMMASLLLAVACQGKRIETVESLGGDKVDPVVRAFVTHDAEQCGFCTPGFVVAVRAFLNKNPKATIDEIRAGLNGNICRCGTYANVIQAAVAVVKGDVNG
ncbi:MAG: (2Fe-2S)-binding protein [Planctomycetia bacterium]|nr:(2Fe-2S)-binding protein [Planctomycetia bacterium]